jgi:1-pyrroline-5-carboxylate dehydrogenase
VYAVTPFNFTSIAGNLPTAPALMGNTVVWKPASSAMLSAYYVMRLLEESGLPPGVINLVPGNPAEISDICLGDPALAGVHFTGSTGVFNSMWKTIGASMANYRSYPRIVGETGGKDFIVAHMSADVEALAVAIVRGAFEYQGQKCSAASRIYVPRSIWPEVKERVVAMMKDIKMGDVQDFRNFMGAVIDKKAFTKISEYLDDAKKNASIIQGGKADGSKGYGPFNWRDSNIEYMTYVEAAVRHIMAAADREDIDPETGEFKVLHLALARATLGILIDALEHGTVIDNRPANARGVVAQLLRDLRKKQ